MARRFENILETVGRTPVVKVAKLAPPEIELFVKLEAFNPLGSVKDRLALGVIEAAECSGELKPGQTVIEATSGNTLEWCEFCWSVRKLFKEFDISYRSVDLDSADYQKDDWGGQVRNALKARTNSPTIPQIFVGNQHIGGCTETFDAFNDGSLQQLMRDNGIKFKQADNVNAYSFLPKWLQPR